MAAIVELKVYDVAMKALSPRRLPIPSSSMPLNTLTFIHRLLFTSVKAGERNNCAMICTKEH